MAGVQSIERAFSILRALAVRPIGVTGLAKRVDLPKSTVARLLSALESEGAVQQVEAGGDYRLGPGIEEIAGTSRQGRSLVATSRPFLLGLTEQLGEASGLSILEEGRVYFLDQVDGENDVQVRDWTGEFAPAHTVAAGLVMLAFMDDADLEEIISGGLDAVTPSSVTDADELRERIVQIRTAGYAWAAGEFAEGISSVAAPVLGPNGVEAALHVHGPEYRFPNPDHSHDIGLLVVEAADGLGTLLCEYAD